MLPLIFLATFGAVSLIAWQLMRPKPDVVGRRLGLTPASVHRGPRESLVKRAGKSVGGKLGRAAAKLLPQNFVKGIEQKLIQANEPWPLVGFLGAWAGSALFGVLLVAYAAANMANMTPLRLAALSIAILPAFAMLPYIILRRKVINRQRAVLRELPDALDLLVTCVEAGMGVDSAFATVVEKSEGPLADTFSEYLKEAGLGISRRQALTRVSEKTGVPQLIGLAGAVSQGEELGTPIGDVLRVQADDLRRDRQERAQTAAQRAPVLMTIPLVLCFMPAMAAVVVVPSILNLARFVGNIGD